MTDELFSATGPEGRNQDAARFEDRLVAFGIALDWTPVCRNVDLYISEGRQSRGVDVLWALENPQSRRDEGWIGEGKRLDGPQRYTPKKLRTDLQPLRDKIARLQGSPIRFFNHPTIREHVQDLVGGVLAHHSSNYDAARVAARMQEVELQRMERGLTPSRISFLGPDTLNGLSEAFSRFGLAKRFYWPPNEYHKGRWAKACPPEQLSYGLLAYEADQGERVLWVRDTLTHHDIVPLGDVAHQWGIRFTTAAFADLTDEQWRIVATDWRRHARRSRGPGYEGSLPDEAVALEMTNSSMQEFNRQWAVAGA